jgi:hypothetical protein
MIIPIIGEIIASASRDSESKKIAKEMDFLVN